jgi:ribosomal protein S18 acetylase RimI-like enzyme
MIDIRPANRADLPRVSQLAGALVRMHHAVDPKRFMLMPNVESGYAWWFERQLKNDDAVILVAEEAGAIIGYAYGSKEPRDWNMLLDEHGALHDVYVDEAKRRSGAGKMLVSAMIRRLEELGCERIVLSTMVSNEPAQKLFAACGFRPTMLEMTRG